MPYIELANGRVWYDERGQGEALVLLHGGAVDSRFFGNVIPGLAERFRVISTDLWGHGRSPDREEPFSLESFAADVAELIERIAGGRAHVLGHSIGAGVALKLVVQRPDLVARHVQISGGFDVEADTPPQGSPDIDHMVSQTVAFLGASYGEVSPDGAEHFAVVTRKDFEMSAREPRFAVDQIRGIEHRTLVMVADDDITPIWHQVDFYRALPNGELAVVPGTSHFLLQEKPDVCNAILLDFLANDPVATVAPVHRAGAQPAAADA